MMTASDVLILLESLQASYPDQLAGNVIHDEIAAAIQEVVHDHRHATVEALRELIGVRIPQSTRRPDDARADARLWLALTIAARYKLVELTPDLNALIADIRSGKTFLPYYEEMVRSLVGTAFPSI
jgi:hypothetical protein